MPVVAYFHGMNLVYSPIAATGSTIDLDENEFHHIQVLRMRDGDMLHVFDGRGNLFKATMSTITKKTALVTIAELLRNEPISKSKLHVAIAPTKNIDRVEWFAEKVTEIGVYKITPVICQRSERREIRHDRLEKVVLSAAKQSLHLNLPIVAQSQSLKEFIKRMATDGSRKFIAYCEEKSVLLKDSFEPGESITVLIGPEGDFSNEEVEMAKEAGFIPVSLGDSRLRTETAGVMVSAIFSLNK